MRTLLLLALALITGGFIYPAQDSVFHGRVVEDHSRMGLAAVSVRVSRMGVPGVIKEVETDRSGDFTITGLQPGAYQFAITKSNYMPTTVRMVTQAGTPPVQPVPLVRLVRYGVITGRVSPASAGGVSVLEEVPEGVVARRFVATANSAGEYRAFGLPPGRYVVGTVSRGLRLHPNNAQPREFSISGGEDYDRIDLSNPQTESFAVTGTVRSPEPVSSYLVAVVSPDRPALIHARIAVTGPFRFPDILPGTYDVLVSAGLPPGPQLYGKMRFSVAAQAVENLEVPVQPGRTAEFSVQSGACLQGAVVTLSLLEAWTTGAAASVSAELVVGKTTRFDRLFPSRYQVSVRDSAGSCYGVTDRILDLSGASAPLRSVILKSAASIHGKVGATNLPASVSVVLRDMEPGRESPVQAVFVRSGDPFGFQNLAPGRYCLAVHSNEESSERWAPESGCASNRLDLSAGDTPEVDLPITGN